MSSKPRVEIKTTVSVLVDGNCVGREDYHFASPKSESPNEVLGFMQEVQETLGEIAKKCAVIAIWKGSIAIRRQLVKDEDEMKKVAGAANDVPEADSAEAFCGQVGGGGEGEGAAAG